MRQTEGSKRATSDALGSNEVDMTKHSKAERERRKEEHEAVVRIESAWRASVPADRAKEFAQAVEEARARGPVEKPPDMAPGTLPRPPRPGREPKPKKEPVRSRRRY
jgi:hypothetical protein